MKKTIFFLLLVFVSTSYGQLQKEYGTGLTPEEVKQMKIEGAKIIASQTYLDMMENAKEFGIKVAGTRPPVMSDQEWNTWISANISKTKFASVEEATRLRNEGLALVKKLQDENPNFYQVMKKATREQVNEISQRK